MNDSATKSTDVSFLRLMLIVLSVGVVFSAGCTQLPSWQNQSIVSKQDGQIDLQFGMARIIERNGGFAEARESYLRILEMDPEFVPALHRLGVVSIKMDDLEIALRHLNRAVQSGSPSSELLGDLGYAQFLADDFSAATKTLSEAVKRDSTNHRNINNLALVLGCKGE